VKQIQEAIDEVASWVAADTADTHVLLKWTATVERFGHACQLERAHALLVERVDRPGTGAYLIERWRRLVVQTFPARQFTKDLLCARLKGEEFWLSWLHVLRRPGSGATREQQSAAAADFCEWLRQSDDWLGMVARHPQVLHFIEAHGLMQKLWELLTLTAEHLAQSDQSAANARRVRVYRRVLTSATRKMTATGAEDSLCGTLGLAAQELGARGPDPELLFAYMKALEVRRSDVEITHEMASLIYGLAEQHLAQSPNDRPSRKDFVRFFRVMGWLDQAEGLL